MHGRMVPTVQQADRRRLTRPGLTGATALFHRVITVQSAPAILRLSSLVGQSLPAMTDRERQHLPVHQPSARLVLSRVVVNAVVLVGVGQPAVRMGCLLYTSDAADE